MYFSARPQRSAGETHPISGQGMPKPERSTDSEPPHWTPLTQLGASLHLADTACQQLIRCTQKMKRSLVCERIEQSVNKQAERGRNTQQTCGYSDPQGSNPETAVRVPQCGTMFRRRRVQSRRLSRTVATLTWKLGGQRTNPPSSWVAARPPPADRIPLRGGKCCASSDPAPWSLRCVWWPRFLQR